VRDAVRFSKGDIVRRRTFAAFAAIAVLASIGGLAQTPQSKGGGDVTGSYDQFFWSASGQTQKFTKYDLNGGLLASWGTFGALPGGFWGVHQFHVDSEGNLYTADVHVGRPQKFRPRPGADASRLIRK
jgi:hypothetical protein